MAGTTESKLEYLIRSKEDVRLAINRMLVPCPEDTPFLEYGPKIKQVDVDLSDATVTSDDLMEGVIAYDAKEQRLVGTIPDIGPLNFEPSDEEYIIPYGRTDGGKVNKADITKLAEYEACLRIANSVDNLDDYSNTTATAEDIAKGKTAYSNGELIEGTLDAARYNAVINGTLRAGTTSTPFTRTTIYALIKELPEGLTVSGTSAQYMFERCSGLIKIPEIDISNVTNTSYMFQYCTSLQEIPVLDTSNVTNMTAMFQRCLALVKIPALNTSRITSASALFYECESLEEIPELNFNLVTNMSNTFQSCKKLKHISFTSTNKLTDMLATFSGCASLLALPPLDTSNVTTMQALVSGCTSLKEFPALNTSKVTTMEYMCQNCASLETIPVLDTSAIRIFSKVFNNCPNLTDESLNNILQMCVNAVKLNSTYKNLKSVGLSSAQATKCQSLSNWAAFSAAGWTTGY